MPEEYDDGRDCEIEARDKEYKDFAGVHYMWKPDLQSEYWYMRLISTGDEVSNELIDNASGAYLTERFYKKGRGVRTDDDKSITDKEKTWKYVDNSWGTYSTYYLVGVYWTVWTVFEVLWTILAFLFGTKLWSRLPLLVWVASTAASYAAAGHYHHRCSDYEDDCHDSAYSQMFMFRALSGAMITIGAASIILNVLPRSINRKL